MRHTNYDPIAAGYDERYVNENYSGIERALLEFVGTGSQHVLEVGCGTGHWLELLNTHHVVATGLDLSWKMLSLAHAKVIPRRVIQGRAESLPFMGSRFDRVCSINAHHHFANKPAFLAEARRVLRPGGTFMTVALDPHTGTDHWWVYDYFEGTLNIDKERYPSSRQLREWLNMVGITEVVTREVQHLLSDSLASQALTDDFITASYTSQLAVLTTAEFSAGIERIRAAMAEDSGLRLTSDLRIYATYGRVPA